MVVAQIFYALSLLLFAFNLQATPLPDWPFRVLRSDHFEVIYREDQKPLAKTYILAAEQARELLLPVFKEGPDNTIIFLSDDTDLSNGMATFLPYPMITVYPALPSTLDSIDDYGDWPLEMIVHEYTHILNMYPAHSFYRPLSWIFGGVVRPNAILPKWYLEGLAVNLESRFTDHGRLRADETQAQARALVLSGNLRKETLARINEQELLTWPFGTRPYLFGGWWWNSVQNEQGQDVIETWNQNYSRRLPFLLNGPMQDTTRKSAEDLLNFSYDHIEKISLEQLTTLRSAEVNEGKALINEKGTLSVFALSPSGNQLVYFLNTSGLGTTARLRSRTNPQQSFGEVEGQRLFRSNGASKISWLDENRFVFDQLDISRPNVTYRDLFVYNIKDHSRKRLTDGLRAEQPAASPNSETIAFIQNDANRNHLALISSNANATKSAKILIHGNFNQRFSGPTFLNDNELLFALRTRQGRERLYVYNLKTNRTGIWNSQLNSAQNARKIKNGILVSDDKTHARNIYLIKDSESSPQAVTNTLTHIETSDYDPNRKELLYSELTADGPKLHSQPLKEYHPKEIVPDKFAPVPELKTSKVEYSEASYQPVRYLLPNYWVPMVYSVDNGGFLFQGITTNNDPAGRNFYSLNAAIDTITKKPSYGLNYVNSSFRTDLGVSYSHYISYLGGTNYVLQSDLLVGSVSGRWPFDTRNFKWTAAYLQNTSQSGIVYKREGPQISAQWNRLQNPLNSWNGFLIEASHQQYIQANSQDLTYGRSYLHMADVLQLGGGHRFVLHLRGAVSPDLPFYDVVDLGDRNVGGNYLVNLTNSDFLLRGYPSSAFVGRKITNANFEYVLPMLELAQGYGSFPLFLRSTELALFADALSVDGGGYIPSQTNYFRTSLSDYFMGTGAELRLSTTAGYHLPVSFVLGAYYGLNQRYGGGFSPFIGFGLGDLSALQYKTP